MDQIKIVKKPKTYQITAIFDDELEKFITIGRKSEEEILLQGIVHRLMSPKGKVTKREKFDGTIVIEVIA